MGKKDSPFISSMDRHIGARLKQYRLSQGVASGELAEAVGLKQEDLEQIESGQRPMDAADLFRISNWLSIDPGYFFKGMALSIMGSTKCYA